mmetsp:Transcript_20074/g.64034  ORF Transcript_20074/g.64034 Transcript_20074/m.64034 type:complete len:214 (+) Transcript_20074:405-1046(+)
MACWRSCCPEPLWLQGVGTWESSHSRLRLQLPPERASWPGVSVVGPGLESAVPSARSSQRCAHCGRCGVSWAMARRGWSCGWALGPELVLWRRWRSVVLDGCADPVRSRAARQMRWVLHSCLPALGRLGRWLSRWRQSPIGCHPAWRPWTKRPQSWRRTTRKSRKQWAQARKACGGRCASHGSSHSRCAVYEARCCSGALWRNGGPNPARDPG